MLIKGFQAVHDFQEIFYIIIDWFISCVNVFFGSL